VECATHELWKEIEPKSFPIPKRFSKDEKGALSMILLIMRINVVHKVFCDNQIDQHFHGV
jgi:hypothetical protein